MTSTSTATTWVCRPRCSPRPTARHTWPSSTRRPKSWCTRRYVGVNGNCGFSSSTSHFEWQCDVIDDDIGDVGTGRTVAITGDPSGAPMIAFRDASSDFGATVLASPSRTSRRPPVPPDRTAARSTRSTPGSAPPWTLAGAGRTRPPQWPWRATPRASPSPTTSSTPMPPPRRATSSCSSWPAALRRRLRERQRGRVVVGRA